MKERRSPNAANKTHSSIPVCQAAHVSVHELEAPHRLSLQYHTDYPAIKDHTGYPATN
jgi:hypothetical protein